MSVKNEAIALTINHVSMLLDRLNGNEDLSEQECMQVISDLEYLQTMSFTTEKGDTEVIMNLNIEELFDEFNNDADGSKELLQSMLSVISEGRVPSEKAVEELNGSIKLLQQKYNSIYSLALAQIPAEEIPSTGLAAREYVEAVRNSASLQYKKQLESVKKTLEDFIRVQSLVNNYASALLPYQDEAKELMVSLESGETRELEVIEQQIAGPKVFLESLKCDDLDSDEGMDLLDQISEFYPRRIQNGLAAGKYFLSSEESTSSVEDSDSNTESMEVTEEAATAEPETENTTEAVAEVMDQTTENGEEKAVSEEESTQNKAIQGDNPEKENVGTSEFVKKIIDAELLISDTRKLGFFSKDISTNEEKKITTSVFQNDIRKGNEKAAKVILRELFKKNNITSDMLTEMKGMPGVLVNSTFDYLQRKGYIRRYKISLLGEFYCASPRLMKAVTFKDAAKYIGIPQRAIEDWGESIEDKATSAASRIAYGTLYMDSVKRFTNLGNNSFTENSIESAEAFIARVFPAEKENESDLHLGVFWSNTDECDAYLKALSNSLGKWTPLKRVVFSALDKEKANQFAEILFDEFKDNLTAEEYYLYSLIDNAYYLYPSMDKVDTEMIGTQSTEATENENNTEENIQIIEEKENETASKETTVEGPVVYETAVEITETATNTKTQLPSSENDHPAEIKVTNTSTEADLHTEDDVRSTVARLINMGKTYAATAYAKAIALLQPQFNLFYNQLAHAVNDPMGHCLYSTDNVFTLIENRSELDDALVISTALRTFFSNQVLYDYNIKSYYSGIKEYKLLGDFPALRKVLYSLMEFKDTQKKGLDVYADYRTKNQSNLNQEIRKLQQEASAFYDNFVVGRKKEKASQKRFLETKKLIFSANSDLGLYIKAIVDMDDDMQPLAMDFLKETFYKEGTAISEDTIDADCLWSYIMVYWEKAGDLMMYRRHSDLMSHLRSNITSTTTKAVQLIARWCDLVKRKNNQDEDEGDVAYKVIRKTLIENLEEAIHDMAEVCNAKDLVTPDEMAGLRILINTMQELLDCVSGTYIESSRKYFYIPFLLTDEVMLDESYLPDMEMHSSTMTPLMPAGRILEHVKNVELLQTSFNDRLTAILDDKGDDYGSARLIYGYLSANNSEGDLTAIADAIEAGEIYAKETADLRKDDFIGELELAQSYGQIDNSIEDKKEKILQIIDEWYEWACDSANYGFFKKVMDSYLAEIKEEAKSREADLLEQLERFKTTTIPGLSADAKNKRVLRIQAMIKEQNYTVAEDLLARANASEEDREEMIEEDFLKDFLDNYDDYYKPVSQKDKAFATLVSARTRNKEERGARKMAENWLPGGSLLGKDRLEILLTCFGFKVDSIKPQPAIGKFEHFTVQTVSVKGGQRANYTHPIAAFGSGASEEGFRVVCINGNYDADSLIEIMKQIGNAKHTMILYDNALPMTERRKLARKSKNALGDKLICVVDRTVMMFLVRNYDETKNNKMLIALVTPFGYYQPYVWESANVMPPEIFMGRKLELERIKSPTGVNIVYGGRQLGKSALLKKAKEDIDRDENGNRAILVDIKGLDYKKAAKKVGHALFDQWILDDDIDTDDWEVLARAVRRRLQSEQNKIPYLLLLLDEADIFIDSCGGSVNYQPFDALKEIQSIGAGRFKFVIAGLRNIVRFKREALENNSVLTHLEPMTVKPFNTSEARELMEIPLHYLGLRFPKEKESLITLILATTNYFPGLIQMYCAKLINAMRNKDYANYDEVDTPIYEVSEDHIKKVLADPEFTQQIREKYIITLKLDEDNYYYLIALLMAYLYHNNGYNEGYSATDIRNAGCDLEVGKIANLEIGKLESFMEELKELNVLRNTDESHYLFTRFTFFQMMGTRAEVDDKLVEYMED